MVSATDDLLEHNRAYARDFARGDLAAPPRLRVAVLACMDARLDVSRSLGLHEGDAHVIRNAGGLVSEDAIRSLAISQHLLGTEEIVLIHHTDCGMLTFTDERFADQLDSETGQRPSWQAESFTSLEDDVRASAKRILDSPFVPKKDAVRGFVFDVATGRLHEVSQA